MTEQWQPPVNLVKFLGWANDVDAVMHSWTGEQHDRLDSVRAKDDPEVLFHMHDMARRHLGSVAHRFNRED